MEYVFCLWFVFFFPHAFDQVPPLLLCSGGAGQYQRLAAAPGCGLLSYPPGVHGGWVHQPALETNRNNFQAMMGLNAKNYMLLKLLYSSDSQYCFFILWLFSNFYPSNSSCPMMPMRPLLRASDISSQRKALQHGANAKFCKGNCTRIDGICNDNVSLKSFFLVIFWTFLIPEGMGVLIVKLLMLKADSLWMLQGFFKESFE